REKAIPVASFDRSIMLLMIANLVNIEVNVVVAQVLDVALDPVLRANEAFTRLFCAVIALPFNLTVLALVLWFGLPTTLSRAALVVCFQLSFAVAFGLVAAAIAVPVAYVVWSAGSFDEPKGSVIVGVLAGMVCAIAVFVKVSEQFEDSDPPATGDR